MKTEERNETVKKITGAIEGLFKELEEKNALCSEYLEHLVRIKAEFENYKKRVEKERLDYIKYSNAELILKLLPVIEGFKRGIDSTRNTGNIQDFVRGMEMIYRELQDVLKRNGLTEIEAEGRPFDPHLHEVVEYVETQDFPENTVVEEVQTGYMVYDRVLRPALVKISRKPSEKK